MTRPTETAQSDQDDPAPGRALAALLSLLGSWRGSDVTRAAAMAASAFGIPPTALQHMRTGSCHVFRDDDGHIYRVPTRRKSAKWFRDQYAAIAAVADRMPIAVPLADVREAGRPVARYREIPGVALNRIFSGLGPEVRAACAETLAVAFAAIHAAPPPPDCPRALFPSGIGLKIGVLEAIDTDESRTAAQALRTTAEAVRQAVAASPLCLCHGDLKGANILATPDGTLTGIIDFGSAGMGPREWDLARTRLPGPTLDRLVEAYESHSGIRLDRARLDLFRRREETIARAAALMETHGRRMEIRGRRDTLFGPLLLAIRRWRQK